MSTVIRERPILFSDAMVRAILDGKKTQTRRLLQSRSRIPGWPRVYTANRWTVLSHPGGGWMAVDVPNCTGFKAIYRRGFDCPYGAVGDRLWVRETWGDQFADHPKCHDGRKPQRGDKIVYRANDADAWQWREGGGSRGNFVWRPSIHMPRWASRITLEITGIRVERLNEISREDALAEGVTKVREGCYVVRGTPQDHAGLGHSCPITAFNLLWDDINEARGYGWNVNPWVWVIEFKQVPA